MTSKSVVPQGEPVAWVAEGKERVGFGREEIRKFVVFDQTLPVGTAFYTTPPSVEVETIDGHSKHWWQHEVNNARAEGYERGFAAGKETTKEKATKVCDDLYKHDRKESGYDEGWNDALGTAEQAIRSIK